MSRSASRSGSRSGSWDAGVGRFGTPSPGVANCRGWWALDDASGTLVDSRGLNSLDIIVGAPTYSVAGAKQGTGVSFLGATPDYARKTSSNAIATAFPITVAGWVKAAPGAVGVLFAFGVSADSNKYFWLRIVADKLQVTARNTTVGSNSSTASVADNTWHHVACVFVSATERRLYIDGAADGGGSALTSAGYVASTAITMGAGLISAAVSTPFTGTLDEWTVWDKQLTLEELQWLYNLGTGRTYSEL